MVDVYSLRFQNRRCSGSATQDLECGTNGSVHVDYPPCRPDLVPSTEDRIYQVMIWGCICWYGVTVNINSEKYETILEDNI